MPNPTPPVTARSIGLTSDEAKRRLSTSGANEIARTDGTPWWRMLAGQFQSTLVLLLLAACGLSAAVGEVVDAVAIGAIVLMNGFIGFWQERGAQNAVLALRAMTGPHARVVRDGQVIDIAARDVVAGDVLALEEGDVVAADAHIVDAHVLTANEAALTGESLPVEKGPKAVPSGAPLAERTDHVFLGTHVTSGTGRAEVVATGMSTELGKIAHLLASAEDEDTPLQKELARVGGSLLWLCLGIVSIVAIAGLVQGQPWLEVLMLAVPLAVAAVPEGLPAVVTIALAVGVKRMAARNVLVRRLPAVETLGAATIVCTDKTGTLTTGDMTVREVWGPDPAAVLAAAAACCDAELHADGTAVGDPTEIAILRAAAAGGFLREGIEAENPRVDVNPFSADRKRMSILRRDGKLYVKGAVDLLLPLVVDGAPGAMEANIEFASRGIRVLGVAIGDGPGEDHLHLIGILGLADPPRPEAIVAIAAARKAGIRTVMITGDHPLTAVAIAREMGIIGPDEDPSKHVHARATPADKLRIVRDWKRDGAIVAMTGDGVNDAPALREAHIGIAMGKTGTEVTREAADMVLADDNFASIIEAVREGRGIWENIQKTIVYLLGGNFGELLTVLVATVLGMPSPLSALMLLWVNLVTDGLPALALVMDPAPPDALEHAPRPPGRRMIGRTEWLRIALTGVLQATVVVSAFSWSYRTQDLAHARSLAFAVIVFEELFRTFAARSFDKTFWQVGATTNVRLLAVIGFSALLQLGLHEFAPTRSLFGLQPLTLGEAALAIGLGFIPVTVLEGIKLARMLWNRSTR